jgi:hypothetical protein
MEKILTYTQYLVLIAFHSINSVCSCKISSVIRCLKTEKLFNSLSVNTVCLATLYVESRPRGNEHSVVSIYCLGVNVQRENESVVLQYLFKTGMYNYDNSVSYQSKLLAKRNI